MPIIQKYTPECSMDEMVFREEGSDKILNLEEPVFTLSKRRIVMHMITLSPPPVPSVSIT